MQQGRSCGSAIRARLGVVQLWNVAYLAVLGLAGTWIASRRVEKLLLT